MNNHKFLTLLLVCLVTCSACNRLDIGGIFGGCKPHHDARFKHSMVWNDVYCLSNNLEDDCLAHIHAKDSAYYTIYWATDLHIEGEGMTVMLDTFVSMSMGNYTIQGKTINVGDTATAVIFCGDIIDAKNNYPVFYRHIQPLYDNHVPVFCTPGNHDLCFGQWTEYEAHFHTSTYWFDITTPNGKKDLYISVDSGDATLGSEQFKWLKNLLEQKSKEGYRHIIVFTHTHMFKRDSNNAHGANYAVEEIYELTYLFSKYRVEYYICGHDHSHEETTYKNVKYYTIGAMKDSYLGKAAYMTMTVFNTTGQDAAPVYLELHRMSGENYISWDDVNN